MAAIIQQALISYTNIDIARYIIAIYQKIAYHKLINALNRQNLTGLEKIYRFPYTLFMSNETIDFTCDVCNSVYENYIKCYKCLYHYFDSRYHGYSAHSTSSSRYFCQPCYNELGYKHDWSIDEEILKQHTHDIIQSNFGSLK
jgi:hypothetical protein